MCTFVGGEEGGELVNTVWDHGLDTVQYSASSDPVYGEGIGPVWGRARGPIKEKTKKKKRRGKKEKDTIKKKLSCTLSQADERARNSKRGGGEVREDGGAEETCPHLAICVRRRRVRGFGVLDRSA